MKSAGKIIFILLWIGIIAGPVVSLTDIIKPSSLQQKEQACEQPVEEESEKEGEKKEKNPELAFLCEINDFSGIKFQSQYYFDFFSLKDTFLTIFSPPPQS